MRNDWAPNAAGPAGALGIAALATTAWSYPFGREGMSPGTSLFQPSWPLTDPVWKSGRLEVRGDGIRRCDTAWKQGDAREGREQPDDRLTRQDRTDNAAGTEHSDHLPR